MNVRKRERSGELRTIVSHYLEPLMLHVRNNREAFLAGGRFSRGLVRQQEDSVYSTPAALASVQSWAAECRLLCRSQLFA